MNSLRYDDVWIKKVYRIAAKERKTKRRAKKVERRQKEDKQMMGDAMVTFNIGGIKEDLDSCLNWLLYNY